MKLLVGTQQDKWFNADGTPTLFGFERLKFLLENSLTQKVSPVEPANGQSPVYSTTTKQYEPG
jgi:hypothetical protein